jgi:hypothetical protein
MPQLYVQDLDSYNVRPSQVLSSNGPLDMLPNVQDELYAYLSVRNAVDGLPQLYTHRDGVIDHRASSNERESIAEEDVPMHICQEMASGKGLSPSISGPLLSNEIVEYQNKITTTSILGELLGQNKARRLVKIRITTSDSPQSEHTPRAVFQRTRDLELSGLDKADEDFLIAKGVFDLPSQSIW